MTRSDYYDFYHYIYLPERDEDSMKPFHLERLVDVRNRARRAMRNVPVKLGASLIEAGLRLGGGNHHPLVRELSDRFLVQHTIATLQSASRGQDGSRNRIC